eukprot:scaffold7227_cov160-Amphora_coffeaeformis.AAC.16
MHRAMVDLFFAGARVEKYVSRQTHIDFDTQEASQGRNLNPTTIPTVRLLQCSMETPSLFQPFSSQRLVWDIYYRQVFLASLGQKALDSWHWFAPLNTAEHRQECIKRKTKASQPVIRVGNDRWRRG